MTEPTRTSIVVRNSNFVLLNDICPKSCGADAQWYRLPYLFFALFLDSQQSTSNGIELNLGGGFLSEKLG
jgi:hypothetical protein